MSNSLRNFSCFAVASAILIAASPGPAFAISFCARDLDGTYKIEGQDENENRGGFYCTLSGMVPFPSRTPDKHPGRKNRVVLSSSDVEEFQIVSSGCDEFEIKFKWKPRFHPENHDTPDSVTFDLSNISGTFDHRQVTEDNKSFELYSEDPRISWGGDYGSVMGVLHRSFKIDASQADQLLIQTSTKKIGVASFCGLPLPFPNQSVTETTCKLVRVR